jgi:two-component system response regulator (stage 0 sporulation protein A)
LENNIKFFTSVSGGELPPARFETTSRITGTLKTIGVPANILGYLYARDAIALVMHDRAAINAITKIIYPAVAKSFGTTPSRVERNIRHAIETAWNRGDINIQQRFFASTVSYTKGKPTNAEFIATIAEHLLHNAT